MRRDQAEAFGPLGIHPLRWTLAATGAAFGAIGVMHWLAGGPDFGHCLAGAAAGDHCGYCYAAIAALLAAAAPFPRPFAERLRSR